MSKLGDHIEYVKGFAFKSKDYTETGIPVIRVSNFTDNSIDIKDVYHIPKERFSEFQKVNLIKDDIVIATVGSWPTNPSSVVGKTIRVPPEANNTLLNQNAVRIRSLDKDEQLYFYYVLKDKSFSDYIISTAQGSANQASITLKSILDYDLPNIDSKEKRIKIGKTLATYDEKIQLNTQINQTLEQIAQALFKSWFIDFDPVRAKVQALSDGLSLEQAELAAMQAISGKTPEELTALSQAEPECYAELAETTKAFPCEIVEVDGVEVPKGWEVLNANDVIEFNPKETLKKDTLAYYLDMASLPTQGCSPDLPILRKFTSGTRFRNGDTLFARITPCLENGKTAFIQYLPEGTVAWGSTEYIVMRTKGIIPKPYSYLLARYESFREYAIRSMTGTSGRQRTQLDIIETYKVVSPSDNKLWESFSKIINPIFETINSNTNKNITLYNIRDLLLPKLLNEVI
jgi:type I restriction-modification system specificity determinant XF2741